MRVVIRVSTRLIIRVVMVLIIRVNNKGNGLIIAFLSPYYYLTLALTLPYY